MENSEDGTFVGGFFRNKGEGRGVRQDNPRASRLAKVDASEARTRLVDEEGALRAMTRKKPILASMGIPSSALEEGSPEYARCVRLASQYRKKLVKDYFIAHGYVSSGVNSMLVAHALATAASRYLYEKAASDENPAAILKMASSLSDSARQNLLSAWELCSREAVIRKRNVASSEANPWEVQLVTGEVKRPVGRPRKNAIAMMRAGEGSLTTVEDTNESKRRLGTHGNVDAGAGESGQGGYGAEE